MTGLGPELRALIDTAPLAHITTINADGSPHVSVIWIGTEGDQIVSGHLMRNKKVRNLARDPRTVLSFEAPPQPGVFLAEHAVVQATAEVVEDPGTWDLLDRLAKRYVGADHTFPAPRTDAGFTIRYSVLRVGGVGPWVQQQSN